MTTRELDKLTRLLCEACEILRARTDGPFAVSKELRMWWENHRERDRARIAYEEKQQRDAVIQKKVEAYRAGLEAE